MKTGLESLDVGASDITYSGNEGPKSPQEDQQKMAEFQLQEYMEEFERVFPDMKDKRGTPDYMKELQDYFEGLASKQDEGVGSMAMKPGLIDEYRNYKMGQEDAGQPFMSPREYYRSLEQDRMGAAGGGIMRTGFQGGGASYGDSRRSGPAGGATMGGQGNVGGASNRGNGDNRKEQYSVAQTQNIAPTTIAPVEKDTGLETQRLKNIQLVEDFKNKPYEPPKFVPSIIANVALKAFPNFFANMDKRSKERFLASDINWANITDEDDLLAAYKSFNTPDITNEGGGDGPPIILPPVMPTTGMEVGEDVDPKDTTDFVNRFAPVTSLPFEDYVGGIEVPAADGGRIGYAGGGITDLRQGYFLGKLVKKATRGIKKIVKSPIGKAALLYGIGAMGGSYGLGKGLFSKGMFNPMNMKAGLFGANNLMKGYENVSTAKMGGLFEKLGLTKGYGSLMPTAMGGITALSTLPLFMGQEEEDDLDKITGQAARGPSIEDTFGMNLNQIAKGARAGTLDPNVFNFLQPAADGGRIGYAGGGIGDLRGALSKQMFGYDDEEEIKKLALGGSAGLPPVTMVSEGMDSMSFPDDESTGMAQATPTATLPNQMPRPMMDPRMMQQMMMAQKGMMQQPRIMAQEGGMMDMGGLEKDYRNDGGFVPIGGQERADDVPARLSKNEFVFTADAVRNAGGGDIDKGAEIMENMMKNLENGGKVSQGSQGLDGAREMFATQQRLGEVL